MGYIIKPIGKSQPRENVESMHARAIYVLYGCMCMYDYLTEHCDQMTERKYQESAITAARECAA
jgi:hypothetical protein